tara:strand:- start:54 stop:1004 length:951 start_codon:yes stop_codon:yes gene_type:complete
MEYLDFEKPLEELNGQLKKIEQLGEANSLDVKKNIKELKATIKTTKKNIYSNLSPWQKVQLSRHPSRPYTLDYINNLTNGKFIELHGDRNYKDDKAMVGGFGMIDNQTVMFIGQQKGRNTKTRQYRNFGMSNPEGYRKALRLMKIAEKFKKPIITLIDTPGAYPGLEAEERGQGQAIANNIYQMSTIKTPIISIVIGEGASGGALGIGVGDFVLMLQNTWYSVISPESCSSILWRSWEFKKTAAESLKLTAKDMLKAKLIDEIIKEPLGGAHTDPELVYNNVKSVILDKIKVLKKLKQNTLVKKRIEKFCKIGVVK